MAGVHALAVIRMAQTSSSVIHLHSCLIFLLRLALVVSTLTYVNCVVGIRNWTSHKTVVVTPNPNGFSEELLPNQWVLYTCTSNGKSGWFTLANPNDNNVVTLLLYDGQTVALVDNVSDSIDGLLLDNKGNKIQILFINL